MTPSETYLAIAAPVITFLISFSLLCCVYRHMKAREDRRFRHMKRLAEWHQLQEEWRREKL